MLRHVPCVAILVACLAVPLAGAERATFVLTDGSRQSGLIAFHGTGNRNIISLDDYLTKCVEALKAAGIPFAQHWGKNAAWGFPGLVDYMYGNADDQWKNMRSALLTKQTADLFTNDFLQTVSLSDYRVGAPAELIATSEIPI